MKSKIILGNDEMILYIRKRYPSCTIRNERLGRMIWEWLRDKCGASQVEVDRVSYWGVLGSFNDALQLPDHATQFEFDRQELPRLFTYLDELGANS